MSKQQPPKNKDHPYTSRELPGEDFVVQIVDDIAAAEGANDFFECLNKKLYDPLENVCTVSTVTDEELVAVIEDLEKECLKDHHKLIADYLQVLKDMMSTANTVVVRWALAKLVGKALAA